MKIVFAFRSSRMVQIGLILAVVGLVFSQRWILALGIGIGIGSSIDFSVLKEEKEIEAEEDKEDES